MRSLVSPGAQFSEFQSERSPCPLYLPCMLFGYLQSSLKDWALSIPDDMAPITEVTKKIIKTAISLVKFTTPGYEPTGAPAPAPAKNQGKPGLPAGVKMTNYT